jgi:hypothetical protein
MPRISAPTRVDDRRTGRRWKVLGGVAVGVVLLGFGQVTGTANANAAGPAAHYLMTAFTNSSESNMFVYDSPNASTFTMAKANAYSPPSGLVRDPTVMRHSDGYYYIAYTTNWTGNTIGLARSADYLTWTFQRNITISVAPTSGSTWAPEWFKDTDGSINLIMSVSQTGTAGRFQAYKISATNSTLSSWSAPAPLSGIGPNYIDSFIVKVGGIYHDFVKNETTKYIEHATATSLTGPWRFVGTGNWAGWGSGLEGPALVQLPNGSWRIYFDQYGAHRYWYADSSNLTNFSGRTELAGLSGSARHFTVLRENVGDSSALSTGNRSLQSANYPTRYIRHRNNLGYVEEVNSSSPAIARQDGTFKIVAGLANSTCYSLQSVNFPNHYLRHFDFVLALHQNDGSPTFAGDATFCSRTGFAGDATLSFESYNHPGYYIRHYNFALRVDRFVAGSGFAGDASFTVTTPLA